MYDPEKEPTLSHDSTDSLDEEALGATSSLRSRMHSERTLTTEFLLKVRLNRSSAAKSSLRSVRNEKPLVMQQC